VTKVFVTDRNEKKSKGQLKNDENYYIIK